MKPFLSTLAFLPTFTLAQTPSLEQLHKLEKMDQTLRVLEDYQRDVDAHIKRRRSDCAKAIGYAPFCDCINDGIPWVWSFGDYVAITTQNKETNQYAKMDTEMQRAYDKVGAVRDACVRKLNRRP